MSLATLRLLFAHLAWADRQMMEAFAVEMPPDEVLREYAHILGADEIWLSRLQGRASRYGVWPTMTVLDLQQAATELHAAYFAHLDGLTDADLSSEITYTTTTGATYRNRQGDLLLHVSLHGQYHRGKVNALLRQSGRSPKSIDLIFFLRDIGDG